MDLTFREFVELFCNVSGEEYSPLCALILLQEAIGKPHVKDMFPREQKDNKLNSYLRPDRNLSKNTARAILEAYTKPEDKKMQKKRLKEYFTDLCLCDKERISRTKELICKHCPELQYNAQTKLTKKSVLDLLEGLFINMLKQAIKGYRSQPKTSEDLTQNKKAKTSETASSNQRVIEVEESDIKHNPLHKVDASLNKLTKLGRTIADSEKENEIGKMRIFRSPLRSELQSEFEHLRQLADALLISEESPMTSTSDQITELIFGLTADSFVLTEDDFRIISSRNHQLHKLLDLVKKLKTDSAPQQ